MGHVIKLLVFLFLVLVSTFAFGKEASCVSCTQFTYFIIFHGKVFLGTNVYKY